MTPFAALGELEKSGSHMEKQAFGGIEDFLDRSWDQRGGHGGYRPAPMPTRGWGGPRPAPMPTNPGRGIWDRISPPGPAPVPTNPGGIWDRISPPGPAPMPTNPGRGIWDRISPPGPAPVPTNPGGIWDRISPPGPHPFTPVPMPQMPRWGGGRINPFTPVPMPQMPRGGGGRINPFTPVPMPQMPRWGGGRISPFTPVPMPQMPRWGGGRISPNLFTTGGAGVKGITPVTNTGPKVIPAGPFGAYANAEDQRRGEQFLKEREATKGDISEWSSPLDGPKGPGGVGFPGASGRKPTPSKPPVKSSKPKPAHESRSHYSSVEAQKARARRKPVPSPVTNPTTTPPVSVFDHMMGGFNPGPAPVAPVAPSTYEQRKADGVSMISGIPSREYLSMNRGQRDDADNNSLIRQFPGGPEDRKKNHNTNI